MACCAVAAYIVWRLVSLHDSLFGNIQPDSDEKDNHDQDLDESLSSSAGGTSRILPRDGFQTQVSARQNPQQIVGGDVLKTWTCLLSLDGITCGACVQQIETALREIEGVRSAQVSLVLHRARVTYDSAAASPDDLIRAVQDAGYLVRKASTVTDRDGTISDIKTALDESKATWTLSLARLRDEFTASMLASAILVGTGYLGSRLDAAARLIVVAVRVLAVAVCFLVSRHIHVRAARSLLSGRRRTVDTLTSVGMLAALMQSVLPVLARAVGRPRVPSQVTADVAESSLESIGMLCTIVLGGRLLKAVASRRPLSQAGRLARLFPRTAHPVALDQSLDSEGKTPGQVPTDLLQPGDAVLVQAGACIPADGLVVSGEGRVENTWMTGDEKPCGVASGDRVYAGCLLVHGSLVVAVEKSGVKSRLGEVLACITASEESSKVPTVDTQTGRFVDVILLTVLLTVATLLLVGTPWENCLQRIVSMLVCACPCTLELSVPISLISAAASAARSNIQMSARRDRLANAASVKTVLFDKTGTLTSGRLSVCEPILAPEWSCSSEKRREWWAIVSAVEAHAKEHPVTRAIKREADAQLVSLGTGRLVTVKTAQYSPGNGVQGWASLDSGPPVHVAIGSRRFLSSLSIEPDLSSVPEETRSAIATVVIVAIDGKHAGVLVCRDAIRPSARSAIQGLCKLGIRVGIITGDSWDAAALVARSVGIRRDDVRAEMLPLDKAKAVRAEKKRGPVVVVGDNLNDAPAFCESSFGIYVGSGAAGTDAALLPKAGPKLDRGKTEPADLVGAEATGSLAEEHIDLGQVECIVRLARRTTSRIQQNTLLSYAYNLTALTLASGALQRFDPRLDLTPTIASLGMGLNSAFVLWNGLRVGNCGP